ncbi:hypothetical protein JCM11641_005911 [Rhodosporidiobolus odoratus]
MGVLSSIFLWLSPHSDFSRTWFPPASTYEPERMPDQTGKAAIVTGANVGVGYHTARYLHLKGARVYVATRSQEKGLAEVESLWQDVKEKGATGQVIWLQLDLAGLDSVKKAAEEFKQKEKELDLLFCRAGVMVPPVGELTQQGFDLQLGTNVVGHYLFSILLGGLKRDKAVKSWGIRKTAPWRLYGQSKLGNVWVARILQQELSEEGVSMAARPGGLKTELGRSMPSWQSAILSLVLYPAHMGARTQLWGATSPRELPLAARCAFLGFLYPWARVGQADPRSKIEARQAAP